MSHCHATHVISANKAFMDPPGGLFIPADGRLYSNVRGIPLDIVIHSITLSYKGAAGDGIADIIVYADGGNGQVLLKSYHQYYANIGDTVHLTFPNGLLLRPVRNAASNLVTQGYSNGFCYTTVSGHHYTTADETVASSGSVGVTFEGIDPPSDYNLTVTYAYVPQTVLQP